MISENPCWRGKVSDHCSIRTCHLWRAVDAGVVIWSFKMHLFHTGSVCIWQQRTPKSPYACFKIAGKSEVPTPVTRNIGQRHITNADRWQFDMRWELLQHLAPTPWGAAGFWPSLFCMPSNSKGSLKVAKSHQESSNVMRTPLVCLLFGFPVLEIRWKQHLRHIHVPHSVDLTFTLIF